MATTIAQILDLVVDHLRALDRRFPRKAGEFLNRPARFEAYRSAFMRRWQREGVAVGVQGPASDVLICLTSRLITLLDEVR